MGITLIKKIIIGASATIMGSCSILLPSVNFRKESKDIESTLGKAIEKTDALNPKNNNNENLSFSELGDKIKLGYKEKQTVHGKNMTDLPGKEDLMGILLSNENTNRNGKLDELKWKSCDSQNNQEVFCGYLKLHKEKEQYILKISYDGSKGKITVVKKIDESVSYYKHSSRTGVNKNAPDLFENLKSGEESSNNLGEDEVNQPSIVK